MCPLQHGIDSDPRNSRILAGRPTVEPLTKFVKALEQWAPAKFTSQCQPSTIGNKRQCPGPFETKLTERRPKRRRSADFKKEGNSLDREVSIRRCCSSPPHNSTRSPSSPTLQATGPELACPYYKSDPSKYRSCLLTSLRTGPDVREHIERDHRRAEYCPRCYKEFSGKQATGDRRDHIRARKCQLNQGPNTVEGLQGDLLDRLCEWEPVAGTHHPKAQWEEIWRIVFPEAPLPSTTPFLDEQDKYVKVLRDVGRFWEREASEGTMVGFERANKDGSLEALSVTADSGKLRAL
ncbi:hypothetical protein QBC43DRAFT_327172 [Cladorrhinum sp. PSN259]|nr:hypothetical protein QBC43DRAFT_327172 [Cladorrhinum sp. PSN259]